MSAQPDSPELAVDAPQQAGGRPPPLAVDAKMLGAMLGLSLRTVRKMDAAGKLPRPLKIGGHAVRWVVDEVRAWLAAGAPDRRTWECLRKSAP